MYKIHGAQRTQHKICLHVNLRLARFFILCVYNTKYIRVWGKPYTYVAERPTTTTSICSAHNVLTTTMYLCISCTIYEIWNVAALYPSTALTNESTTHSTKHTLIKQTSFCISLPFLMNKRDRMRAIR